MSYFGSKRSYIYLALGVLALILVTQYQNCGARNNSVEGASSGTSAPLITFQKNDQLVSEVSCPNDTLVMKIQGVGQGAVACMGYNIAIRPAPFNAYYCDRDSKFAALSELAGWSYDSTTDTWTKSEVLKNNINLVPGSYTIAVKKLRASSPFLAQVNVTRNDGGDVTHCFADTTSNSIKRPDLSQIPNCANSGPVGRFMGREQLLIAAASYSTCVTLNGHLVQGAGIGPCAAQVCN